MTRSGTGRGSGGRSRTVRMRTWLRFTTRRTSLSRAETRAFRYGPRDRRVYRDLIDSGSVRGEHMLHDGRQVLADLDVDLRAVASYQFTPMDGLPYGKLVSWRDHSGAGSEYLHGDALGSVYAATDAGLYHMDARAYDPDSGRWLQRDPMSFATLSLPRAVRGLVNLTGTFFDPTGLRPYDGISGRLPRPGKFFGRPYRGKAGSHNRDHWSRKALEAAKRFFDKLRKGNKVEIHGNGKVYTADLPGGGEIKFRPQSTTGANNGKTVPAVEISGSPIYATQKIKFWPRTGGGGQGMDCM